MKKERKMDKVYLANCIEVSTRIRQIYQIKRRLGKDICIRFSISFVRKNTNILPNWFIQAIQSDLLKAPLGQAAYDAIKVTTPSQDHRNQITINETNTSEKNQISFYVPSEQSGTLASLDSYNKDESIKPERLFRCPYCIKFSSTLEREYLRHIVLKYRGKSGYPNVSVAG